MPQFSALQDEGSNGPFHDGGPLPPEQSVETSVSPIEPPADYDDGWTNTDDPPDDDYNYGEEIQAEEAEASYEDALEKEETAANKVVAQLDEHITTADGRDITIAQLRGSVVAELAVNEGFIASVLERTGLWKVSENKVETTIESALDLQLIQKNLRTVADRISKIYGKPMEFVVTEKQVEQTQNHAQKDVPVQVQVLVNAFKGTVVTGGKNESV
jgi:DNA polymerase-3 subunit gamma/tau